MKKLRETAAELKKKRVFILFIYLKIKSFRFSLEALSNLNYFVLKNLI